ncbi:MAG: hypothetical protein D3925_13950 [Candidatus Electrothrix sp. AR5]|nr:hypothetical protein [Candidatus Electrothrix sp. AR5]
MNINKFVLGCLSIAFVFNSQHCFAANANSNPQAQENAGNPFDALEQLITENRILIEANQGAITALEVETDAINTRIDGVQAELAEVASQVAMNSADIGTAFIRIAAAEGDIETLRSDLGALASQHQTDIAELETRLDDIQVQINELVAQSTELATELNTRVAELRSFINDNAVGIDVLVLDISLLNAQVGSINSSILALSNQQANLGEQVIGHATQLVNLTAALDALKSRVNAYHDPCLESIAFGDTVTGELINDGECISDSRTGWWGGESHGARYYTFTIASPATVTIRMDGQNCTNSGTLPDPYLYLHLGGRDGEVIRSNDDGGCNLNSRIMQTLQPGTYTIEATSFGSTQYGTFQLSVQ